MVIKEKCNLLQEAHFKIIYTSVVIFLAIFSTANKFFVPPVTALTGIHVNILFVSNAIQWMSSLGLLAV